MIDVKKWEWIADKERMICRNAKYNVTVKMIREKDSIKGKIEDMPIELFGKIAELENGENIIRQITESAEKAFSSVT